MPSVAISAAGKKGTMRPMNEANLRIWARVKVRALIAALLRQIREGRPIP